MRANFPFRYFRFSTFAGTFGDQFAFIGENSIGNGFPRISGPNNDVFSAAGTGGDFPQLSVPEPILPGQSHGKYMYALFWSCGTCRVPCACFRCIAKPPHTLINKLGKRAIMSSAERPHPAQCFESVERGINIWDTPTSQILLMHTDIHGASVFLQLWEIEAWEMPPQKTMLWSETRLLSAFEHNAVEPLF